MIIYKPKITEGNDEICVSARVKIRASDRTFPNTLWFKFLKSYNEYVADRTDCFAALLLPLAMRYGEDLEICGALSHLRSNAAGEHCPYTRYHSEIFRSNRKLIVTICRCYLHPIC